MTTRIKTKMMIKERRNMNESIRNTIIKAIQEATDLETINYWVRELECLEEAES